MLLSLTMGMTKHSHQHHLTVILPPIYTGLQKRTMRLLALPLKSTLHHYKTLRDKLKAHVSKHHGLGDANTNSGYYNYWKGLLTSVNPTTSNSFWSNKIINISQKRNVMKFGTDTLYTQRMAHLYGRATNSSCLLCHQPDSRIHMLSGCQNASIQNMVTERHNIASRLIIKTLNKGDFGGNIILTDIGSETRLAQQSLVLPAHVANRTLPQWLLPNLSAEELRSCSRPDAICILTVGTKNGHQRDIQAVHPSRWVYTSLK